MSETGERRRRRDERSADERTGAQPTATPEWLTTAVPTSPTGIRPAVPGSRRAMRMAATSPSGSTPEVRDGGGSAPEARQAAPGTPGIGTPAWAAAAPPRTDAQPLRRPVLDSREQPPARGVTAAPGSQLPVPAEPPVLPSRPTTPASGSAQWTARRTAWGPVPATGPDGTPGVSSAAPGPLPTRTAVPAGPGPSSGQPVGGAAPAGISRPVATPFGAPAPGAPAPIAPAPAAGPVSQPAAPLWTAGAWTERGTEVITPHPAPSAASAPSSVPASATPPASAPGRPDKAPRAGSWAVAPAQASSDDEASAVSGPFVLSSGQSPFPSTGVTQVAAPAEDDDEPARRRHPYTWLHVIVLAIVAFVLGFLIVALWNQGRSGAEGESATAPAVVETGPVGSSSAV